VILKTQDTPKTRACHPLSRLYQRLCGAVSRICQLPHFKTLLAFR